MLLERVPLGYIARKAQTDVGLVLAITVTVDVALGFSRAIVPDVGIAVPSFLGTAISLILSFKLSQSYDRWWEARKIWGAIVNDSRTLVRQLLSFAPDARELVERMARRQIAWCYALGQSLRGQPWAEGTQGHLQDEDVVHATGHANKPVALLQQHARDLSLLRELGHLNDFQQVGVDDTLTRLTDSMGKAERIRNTVFPATYRVFLHAFIYLFITLLSIALAEIDGAWQVVVTTCIAIPFFLLEKTATHLQDPFSNRPTDTPVTAIARTIETNILQLLGRDETPKPLADHGFYVM